MTTVRYVLLAVIALAVAGFLHFHLPSYDVVRIVGTDIARVDAEARDADGQTVQRTRDVRYINAAAPDGEPRVYRNEDTGWGWPFYFKFESANLAAQADATVSSAEAPRWMMVTYYGWRVPIVSAFPNAVSMREASGPDESTFAWFSWAIIAAVLIGLAVLRRFVLMMFR